MSLLFDERWRSGLHVGSAKPSVLARIRTGRFWRRYDDWDGPEVDANIYGEKASKPYQAFWTPDSEWRDLPNVLNVELDQDYENNGIQVATISLENVVFPEHVGPMGDIYHLIDRGALAPWRGSASPLRGQAHAPNEWYGMLTKNAQIKLWLGYGDALIPAWTGLIDDADMTAAPDRITINARDFGQVLIDEVMFGWVKSRQLPEPIVFEATRKPKGASDKTVGDSVGHGAKASTRRDGHPARFVEDMNLKTTWISGNRGDKDLTEWVEIRLPRGRYESIAIHPGYAGMEVFVGIYARDNGRGGEPCLVDGNPIAEGWIYPSELEAKWQGNAGIVPGDDHGGWPFVRRWASMEEKGQVPLLPGSFDLGDDSVLRVGFRRLKRIAPNVYRASCTRLQAVRRKDPTPIALKPVGRDAEASSRRSAEHAAKNVLDTDRGTKWISDDRSGPDLTEWVEIHLPKGRYESFVIEPGYAGMEMYVGVYARGKSKVDGNAVGEGFVALGNGVVPGDSNGGWPWVAHFPNVEHEFKKAEKFLLGHRFDLGDNSVLRVAFRNLEQAEPGKYRASVIRLKAMTRSASADADKKKQPPRKVIQVDDVADIVRVILRWAGFKEWTIESTGVSFEGETSYSFNRADSLMSVIQKVQEATGYVFFMGPPSDADLSIGVPHFVSNDVVQTPAEIVEIRDDQLLTDVQAKGTDAPLDTEIYVRGKELKRKKGGKSLGKDKTRRVQAKYQPPWTGDGMGHDMAGILRHAFHTEPKARSIFECLVLAHQIALQQALVAAAAEIEIPGNPGFLLNQQVALIDQATGLNTRLYIARRHTTFTGGKSPSFKTSLGGALVDTVYVQGVIADLERLLAGSSK